MIKAAATGKLNFESADSNDRLWLTKEKLILDAIEREDILRLLEVRHLQQAASSVWPALDDKGELYGMHCDNATELAQGIASVLFPFEDWSEKGQRKRDIADMREEYVRRFGDPSTPEGKAAAAKDAERVEKMRAQAEQKQKAEAALLAEQSKKLAELRDRRLRKR